MTPAHRYMAAFVAASLKAAPQVFTRVYDHDAGREIAVGGAVRPDAVDVIEGLGGARFSGTPDALLDHAARSHIHLMLDEGGGFSGFDHASQAHFKGVFAEGGAVQLYDYETGRYHDFHVS